MSSNFKNVLFRTNSSSSIGTGHIMRDLVLAKQYPNANIIFATQNLDGNINHKILESGYKIEILPNNSIDEFQKIIDIYNPDLIIIDSYDIDFNFEKEIKTNNPSSKLLIFDDLYQKHYCDILLNHNIYADKTKYKDLVPDNCELRCGAKYTLLRDEFKQEKEITREKIYDYLLAFGGADTANLNIKVLEILLEIDKNSKIIVITTLANKNLQLLQEFVKDKPNITLEINSTQIAKLINQSKIAIITPSVTANEAYYLQVDFIAIKTADNQEFMYEFLKKNGYEVLEYFDKKAFKEKILNKYIKLIDFVDTTLEEKKMILKWRNHENIKRWMYNQNNISLEEHLSFIKSLKNNISKNYFLVKYNNDYIGVIDFTNIDYETKRCEIGLYINIFLNQKGVGTILMQTIINFGFNQLKLDRLIAEVFDENIKAINLYKKFNFEEIKRKIVNNKKVIYMELKRNQ